MKTMKPRTIRPATKTKSRNRIEGAAKLPVTFPSRIKSILVPIDFSKPAEKALDYAISLAKQFGAKLTLLSVIEPFPTPDFAYYPLVMENDKVVAETKKRLEQVPVKAGVKAELVEKLLVRNGVPFREITDAARMLKVDLIVISTHGYSGLAHVFMGSTAERVVRHAECPVLVVRGRPEESK
jgi:nucleotide-binding universal stress UspA family protein